MEKRRLAVLAVSAMLLVSFSVPGRPFKAAHRVWGLRTVQAAAVVTSQQVQWNSPLHAGGCHESDSLAYDPADD